jgi:hypothetical protein
MIHAPPARVGKLSIASIRNPARKTVTVTNTMTIHVESSSPSLALGLVFLAGSCAVKILSVSLAGRCAGFRDLDLVNLSITTNARGGPGIVLASVAYEAGIISPQFYTTLVLAAVVTSQIAGAWLEFVLRTNRSLLTPKFPTEASTEEVQAPGIGGVKTAQRPHPSIRL